MESDNGKGQSMHTAQNIQTHVSVFTYNKSINEKSIELPCIHKLNPGSRNFTYKMQKSIRCIEFS